MPDTVYWEELIEQFGPRSLAIFFEGTCFVCGGERGKGYSCPCFSIEQKIKNKRIIRKALVETRNKEKNDD